MFCGGNIVEGIFDIGKGEVIEWKRWIYNKVIFFVMILISIMFYS